MPERDHGTETTAAAGHAVRWQTYAASAIGADHVRAGTPIEDAVAAWPAEQADPDGLLVLAVADGHGHARHFRSDRGSRIAVATGISVASKWASAFPAGSAVSRTAAGQLVSELVTQWREAVAADLADDPVAGAPAGSMLADDPAEIPYGSTLLLAVVRGDAAVLAQIGDGEMVLVRPDGRHLTPVPSDSRLDGTHTTSLCQPDAISSFRVALVSLAKTPVFAIFAATDGYSNAQANENWREALAADLVSLGIEHGISWLGGQVGAWAALCASSDGSGDDSTIALALNPAAALSPPAGRRPRQFFSGSGEQTVMPATLLMDKQRLTGSDQPAPTSSAQQPRPPADPPPREVMGPPARPWRDKRWLAGAALVAIALAVILLSTLSGPSALRPTFSPAPGHSASHTGRPTPSPTVGHTARPTPSPALSQRVRPKASPAKSQQVRSKASPTARRGTQPKTSPKAGHPTRPKAGAAAAAGRGAAASPLSRR
jgi:hypothetical protein